MRRKTSNSSFIASFLAIAVKGTSKGDPMRRSLLTLSGLTLAAMLFTPAARADSFTFNFSGSGVTGTVTFTASATGTPGQFLIDSATGTTNGTAIQGILAPGIYPPSSSGDFPNDNLLFD